MKNPRADRVETRLQHSSAHFAAAGTQHGRRVGDRGFAVLLLDEVKDSEGGSRLTPCEPGSSIPADVHAGDPRFDRTRVLIALPGDELLVLPASMARSIPEDSGDLRREARALAAEWRRQHDRALLRTRVSDWLIVYVDRLDEAASRDDVGRALAACAALVAGTPRALVYTTERSLEDGLLRALSSTDADEGLPALPCAEFCGFSHLSVMSAVEARLAGSRNEALVALFSALGAAQLVCCPVAYGTVLILGERRRDRIFTAEDRDLLGWIVERARRALLHLDA